jgi:hypothetical protein
MAVEVAGGVEVIDGDGDALVVGEASASSVPSCRAAYTMYASAANSGISRRISRTLFTTP